MTASTLTQLPLMAGGALLGSLGRAGHWTLSRYLRAPLASTGLLAMVTLTALAGSNALYFQSGHHPAPLFAPAERVATASVPEPVTAPLRTEVVQRVPEPVAAPQPVVSNETTGSVPAATPVVPDAPVGNTDVFEVQRKLAELKLFDGTVDGYYGPKTANAIRAFEERNGLTPMGAMDPSVVQAILNADSAGRMPAARTSRPQAVAAPAPVVAPAPVAEASLGSQTTGAVVPQSSPQPRDQVVARLPALSPAEQTLDHVAQSAANTIDSIIAGLDGTRAAPKATGAPPIPTATLPTTRQVAQTPPREITQAMPAPVAVNKPVAAERPPVEVADISPSPTVPVAAPATNTQLVAQIQRGLASLGFFHAPIDGKPGVETSRAIREFENFYRYKITGQVQPDLVGLLREAGATI